MLCGCDDGRGIWSAHVFGVNVIDVYLEDVDIVCAVSCVCSVSSVSRCEILMGRERMEVVKELKYLETLLSKHGER